MRVVGVDPGYRNIGLAIRGTVAGNPEDMEVLSVLIKNEAFDDVSGLRDVYRGFRQYLEQTGPDIMALEGMAFGRFGNSDSLMKLAEMTGVLKTVAGLLRIPVITIAPQQWKSITVGKALKGKAKGTKAEKNEYLAVIKNYVGVTFPTTDQADAYLIMRALEMVITGEVKNGKIEEQMARHGIQKEFPMFNN
jgi:Holliday junction resolvasome RuvABC endonuclease subunit